MSLIVEVYVGDHIDKSNRTMVAKSVAHNISNLAEVSDYIYEGLEFGNLALDIPRKSHRGKIKGHSRNQSVWELVKKMVEGAINSESN